MFHETKYFIANMTRSFLECSTIDSRYLVEHDAGLLSGGGWVVCDVFLWPQYSMGFVACQAVGVSNFETPNAIRNSFQAIDKHIPA